MHKFSRILAECLVASLALISLTVVFYRLHLNLATTSFIYVIVVVLLSRAGSFASSNLETAKTSRGLGLNVALFNRLNSLGRGTSGIIQSSPLPSFSLSFGQSSSPFRCARSEIVFPNTRIGNSPFRVSLFT
jgi:hypothetical protein